MYFEYVLNLSIVILVTLGFVCIVMQGIAVLTIIYGKDKYILILDSIFSKRKYHSMIWSWKGSRCYWYGFKYPFFCIFNKTKKLSLKMHGFMFINAYASWFWVLALIWVFCFKQPKI